jgi:hypothetical protein
MAVVSIRPAFSNADDALRNTLEGFLTPSPDEAATTNASTWFVSQCPIESI